MFITSTLVGVAWVKPLSINIQIWVTSMKGIEQTNWTITRLSKTLKTLDIPPDILYYFDVYMQLGYTWSTMAK